jgi:hypothetical protein
MSVLPSRPFDVITSGRFHLRDERSVAAAPELGNRREVDAGVRVHVVRAIGGVRDDVVRVGLGQRGEAGPVEVDPVVVDEVRILPGIHAARGEPDLPLLLVDALDVADDPLALRDLLRRLAGYAVVQIQVIPPVALRHPDDFLAVGDIEAVPLAGVAEERLRFLGQDRPRLCRGRVDLDDPVDLMAALVVLEREGAAVLPPHERRHVVCVRERCVVDEHLLLRGDVEEDRPLRVEHVARLGVLERGVFRLQLVFGR